MTDNN